MNSYGFDSLFKNDWFFHLFHDSLCTWLSVSTEALRVFAFTMALLFGTTPNTLYMKTVNKKYNYVGYLTPACGRLEDRQLKHAGGFGPV